MFLTEDKTKSYKSIILLNEMINGNRSFTTIGSGDDKLLEPLFIELMSHGYVSTSGAEYIVTDSGNEVFQTFMKRYTEYLKVYDVFSFVDLEKGEFAFSRFFDFSNDDEWDRYKSDQRFDDLRIAVAMFKKIDPSEIVFMSFINESRFDTSANGWQMDLLSDAVWNKIEDICSTAITPEQVGEDAMSDMINQGSALMIKLMEEEERQREAANVPGANGGSNDNDEVVEEETVEYYQPYYRDPYYISPIWLLPLFLW